MANINKTELIKAIMEGSNMKNYYTAQVIINAFIEQIKLQVEAGNVVSIKGLGTFYFTQKKTLPMPPPSRKFRGDFYWWLHRGEDPTAEFKYLNLSNLKNWAKIKEKISTQGSHVSRNGIRWTNASVEDGLYLTTYYRRKNGSSWQLEPTPYKPRLKCRMSGKMNTPEGMRPIFRALYKYRGGAMAKYYQTINGYLPMTNAEFQSYMNEILPP